MQRQKHDANPRFTGRTANSRLNEEAMVRLFERISKLATLFAASLLIFAANTFAQAAPDKPKEQAPQKSVEKSVEPPNAAQFELLETSYRFEVNGDSRKEVHARVKINSELGVRQFARLNFDYNRSFQSVEIPLVHITHASGGTAEILPSAITDNPNPAVVDFHAFQDVRVKSVRILGLQPSDLLEYRVVTTTTHHPLAPDFWIDHSFDRAGIVTHEIFELAVPRKLAEEKINGNSVLHSTYTGSPAIAVPTDNPERKTYRWEVNNAGGEIRAVSDNTAEPDILFSTLISWSSLSAKFARMWIEPKETGVEELKERRLIPESTSANEITRAGYEYVSARLRTVDLPFGATGFRIRTLKEILDSGYATQEEKCGVLALFEEAAGLQPGILLIGAAAETRRQIVRPSVFTHAMVAVQESKHQYALDPSVEVAPFGVVPPQYRGKPAFRVPARLGDDYTDDPWNASVSEELPFVAKQRVEINGSLNAAGSLSARVKYRLRGDNELLLRVTFHQTPKEKQQEIAQYLALSDGFRGKVTSVKTSDPYATKEPFEVEYEITQDKFVDWTKKPVHIPALLPLPGLPESPKKTVSGERIELGPPLEIELTGTLRLPAGVTAQAPPGTSVKRDYATFASEYSVKENLIRSSRQLNFIARDIAGDRALDLNAFVHAVQNDQSQFFILEKREPPAATKPK